MYNVSEFRQFIGITVFFRPFSLEPVWNDGIVECWNIGYEKRKTDYPTRNVESTIFDDAHQTSIFCFYPKSIPS